MAIFGPAFELKDQWPAGAVWEEARKMVMRYLTEGSEERSRVFSRLEGESVKLDVSESLFLIEEAYLTRESSGVRWEAHREWADVQVILAGRERMEVARVGNLSLEEDLSPQRDMQYFESHEGGSVLCLEPGDVAIFLPVDGHRPGLQVDGPDLVRKLVVKVRL